MDHSLIKIVKNLNNQLLLSITFYKKMCHIEGVKKLMHFTLFYVIKKSRTNDQNMTIVYI